MLLLVCAFKYCAFTSLLISLAWDWLKGTCGFFKSHKGFQRSFFRKGFFPCFSAKALCINLLLLSCKFPSSLLSLVLLRPYEWCSQMRWITMTRTMLRLGHSLILPLAFFAFSFSLDKTPKRQRRSIGLFRYPCLPPRLTLSRISPEEVFPGLGDRVCIEHFLGQCHIATIFASTPIVRYNERTNNIQGTSHTKHAWHNNIYRCTTKSTANLRPILYLTPETNSIFSRIFHLEQLPQGGFSLWGCRWSCLPLHFVVWKWRLPLVEDNIQQNRGAPWLANSEIHGWNRPSNEVFLYLMIKRTKQRQPRDSSQKSVVTLILCAFKLLTPKNLEATTGTGNAMSWFINYQIHKDTREGDTSKSRRL